VLAEAETAAARAAVAGTPLAPHRPRAIERHEFLRRLGLDLLGLDLFRPVNAERRHPRAGTGHGSGGYYPGYPGSGYPGYGWGGGWYYPGYGGYWWPYGYYGWSSGYWGGYPGGWGGGTVYYSNRGEGASLRVLVDPAEARVYVDGYYAGVVDDYDGVFQHLNLEAGSHHIEIEAEDYPLVAFDVLIQPGRTITYRAFTNGSSF
jgi:hypothetical protein